MAEFILLLIVIAIIWGLKKRYSGQTAQFQFLICDSADEAPTGQWYRLNHWQRFNYLRYHPEKDWSKDWRIELPEEEVVGLHHRNGQKPFMLYADKPGFSIKLRREPRNKYDANAIAVDAMHNGKSDHLGYLSKYTAAILRTEPDLDARLHSCEIPAKGEPFRLNITILTRSAAWRKKHQ